MNHQTTGQTYTEWLQQHEIEDVVTYYYCPLCCCYFDDNDNEVINKEEYYEIIEKICNDCLNP